MQRSIHARIVAALLATGLAGAAAAQNAAPAPQPTVSPSETQLDKYASAVQKVAVVAEQYRPRVQAAQDDASRQQVLKEADEKMVSLVQADNLTVEEYNGISQAVQQDPELRQRVIEKINEQAGPGSGGAQQP